MSIEETMRLMVKYRIDEVTTPELTIKRSKHEPFEKQTSNELLNTIANIQTPRLPPLPPSQSSPPEDDDEALLLSIADEADEWSITGN